MLKLSVLVMAYNEADNLLQVVEELIGVLNELSLDYEVVIINDGSKDQTGKVAEKLQTIYKSIRIVNHKTNRGLGEVYRNGFCVARGDYVTFIPADGQFPAIILKDFIPYIDNMDLVLGYLPNRKSSIVAKTLSEIERILYRFLFGVLPKFQGIFLCKRMLFYELELNSAGRGWAILLELIIKATRRHLKIISIPTEMRPRITGKSKVNNLPTIWANLKQAFELRLRIMGRS